MIKYGLMMDGALLKYTSTRNPQDCEGVDESYELGTYGEDWLVNDEITAGYVRSFSTKWYNANYETPINPYVEKKNEIQVVKVEIVTTISTVEVEIPTVEEYLKAKYSRPEDRNHLEYCLEHLRRDDLMPYSLYDLRMNLALLRKEANRGTRKS